MKLFQYDKKTWDNDEVSHTYQFGIINRHKDTPEPTLMPYDVLISNQTSYEPHIPTTYFTHNFSYCFL
jgi:hypothetical protein